MTLCKVKGMLVLSNQLRINTQFTLLVTSTQLVLSFSLSELKIWFSSLNTHCSHQHPPYKTSSDNNATFPARNRKDTKGLKVNEWLVKKKQLRDRYLSQEFVDQNRTKTKVNIGTFIHQVARNSMSMGCFSESARCVSEQLFADTLPMSQWHFRAVLDLGLWSK